MRITYLHQYFNTLEQGGGTRSYEMARRLVKAGHPVTMITSRTNSQDAASGWVVSNEAGIEVHWLSVPYSNAMGKRKRIQAFVKFAWESMLRAASIPSDVIFATSTPLTIAIPGAWAAARNRVPMVFEVRDLWPEMPIAVGALKGTIPIYLAQALERFAYRRSSRVIALSPGMADGIVRTGYPRERISIIPNSSDMELFQVARELGQELRYRFDWLHERPLIIYTGTLGQINGVSYLARIAAAMLPINPEVRFLVVGDGLELGLVERTARSLGVLDRNFFVLGRLPKREIPAVYSAADISTSLFIDLPAMWNNSANKFFDALAAGKPIAINYGGWQASLLNESGAGLQLPPDDPAVAAAMLAQALDDKQFLEKARSAALHLATTRFSRDLLAQQLEATLAAAVADR